MDAMHEKKMWKVAIIHFVACMVVLPSILAVPSALFSSCLSNIFIFLQPQVGIIAGGWLVAAKFGWIDSHSSFVAVCIFFSGLIALVLSPLWSLCFAWLFIKFINWLKSFSSSRQKSF